MLRTPWTRALAVAALLTAAFLLLLALGDLVQLVVLGALLAYLAHPLVRRLEARGLGRTQATVVVFAAIWLTLALAVMAFVPMAAEQLQSLGRLDLSQAVDAIDTAERSLDRRLAPLGVPALELRSRLQAWTAEHLSDLLGFVPSALGLLANLALLPFIMFFVLKDGPAVRRRIVGAAPNRYFEFVLSLLHKMDRQLGGYLRGQFISALIVGVLSVFALWLLGVPYFVVIGAIAGFANIVPYLGPISGTLLAIAASSLAGGGVADAVAIALAFGGVQIVDNTLVQPLVLSRNVSLHPLLILLAVLGGGQLFGAIGLLLAVPIVAIVKVALVETAAALRSYGFE